MTDLAARLAGGVVIADGAMGTVLHAAGNPLDRALPELNLSDAALVRTVHDSYVEVGSEIIQTNTFAANRLRLGADGLADRVAEINEAGVRIARAAAAAAGRPVLVAGSVSPAVTIQQRHRVPPAERAAALAEQIACLAGAGADLIVLETFGYLDELVEAVGVAARVCGLPVIAQATFAADGRTLSGDTPGEVCRALAGLPLLALGTNCTLGPQGLLQVVERLREATDLPLAAQPNAGLPRRTVESRFEYDVETGYVGRYARRLVEAGAALVGGCCGTTPAHVAAVVDAVRDLPRAGGARPVSGTRTAARAAAPAGPGHAGRPARRLVIGAQIDAPPAGRLAEALATAEAARDHGAGVVCLAAGGSPRAHLSPVTVAVHLQNRLGIEAMACVTTWDRTIMALQADLLGAHALGVRRVVCETGSPPLLGDYPHVDGIWDVDSVGLTALLAGLNEGVDHNGLHLAGKTSFEVGARINPGAGDLAAEEARARRKLAAGAGFVLTRPVYELDRLRRLLDGLGDGLGDGAARVLVCVRPLRSFAEAEYLRHEVPDVWVPPATLAALRRAGPSAADVGTELAADLVQRAAEFADGVVIALPAGDEAAEPLFRAARRARPDGAPSMH